MSNAPIVHFEAASTLAVVVSSNEPLLFLSRDQKVIAASTSFCRTFEIDPATIPGRPLASLGNGEWAMPRLASLLQATASGCHPFVDAAGADTCVEVMRHAFGPILRSGEVDTVILAARWIEADIPQIGRTIAEIRRHGTDVIVLGPTVEYHGVFPALLARALAHGDPEMTRIHLVEARFALDRRLEAEARAAGARYVSVTDILCPDGACRLTAPDGSPMQFDYGHLTLPAARWVVERMPAFGR